MSAKSLLDRLYAEGAPKKSRQQRRSAPVASDIPAAPDAPVAPAARPAAGGRVRVIVNTEGRTVEAVVGTVGEAFHFAAVELYGAAIVEHLVERRDQVERLQRRLEPARARRPRTTARAVVGWRSCARRP